MVALPAGWTEKRGLGEKSTASLAGKGLKLGFISITAQILWGRLQKDRELVCSEKRRERRLQYCLDLGKLMPAPAVSFRVP